jgi:hypothetical protein
MAEAATAAGMAKSSILRAIKRGTLSATRDEATGQWRIDPAELHRVYPPGPEAGARNGALNGRAPPCIDPIDAELLEARVRLDSAQRQLNDAHTTIEDLRRRLDIETTERRTAQERVMALLEAPRRRRKWWLWLPLLVLCFFQ